MDVKLCTSFFRSVKNLVQEMDVKFCTSFFRKSQVFYGKTKEKGTLKKAKNIFFFEIISLCCVLILFK